MTSELHPGGEVSQAGLDSAVALLEARGFTSQDFARSHPGGALGRKLLTYVRDVMRTGEQIPIVGIGATVMDALHEIPRKQIGVTAVVDRRGKLAGIFTDGDLRRLLQKNLGFSDMTASDVMTRNPKVIKANVLAVSALELMENFNITQLVVVDEVRKPVGMLHLHDLVKAGLSPKNDV